MSYTKFKFVCCATMASDTLSSIVEDAMREALPRLVELIQKQLKNGKTVDEIVETIADQKLPPSSKPKPRSASESRKSSGRGISKAPASTRGKSEKRQWVSFETYNSDYTDVDVCTFIPSRGDNSTKICCVDVKDPGTSDKARVRCATHKKSDLDTSAQRFNKSVSKSGRSHADRDDEPEVNDKHKPPVASIGRSRTTAGVPRAIGRGSARQVASESESDKKDESEQEDRPASRRGLTSSRPTTRAVSLRVSPKEAEAPSTPVGRRNPLAARMSSRTDTKPDPEPEEEAALTSPSTRRGRDKSEDRSATSVEKPARRLSLEEDSRRYSPREPTPDPEPDSEEQPDDKSSRPSSSRSSPRDDSYAPKRSARVSRRDPTPDLEPDAEEQPEEAADDEASREAQPEMESYTVPNAVGIEFIKLGDTRFLAIDTKNSKALGVYPLEIKDGERIPPIWKSKLNIKYSESELALIKQLTSSE